ncbi:MAG: ABC transporter ATP-binding protein [Chitinophagaceae bacterium]|nr:MAG: ABC transporter ATP-binding protein [Chitinophagaceae bacterium]
MTSTTTGRLREVKNYFDNGDNHVGYRRLLDSAIETQDMDVFAETLAFCDWYDQYQANQQKDASALGTQVSALLEKIAAADTAPAFVSSEPVIRMEKVNKTYQAGSFSLKEIDLQLYPRQIIGLVGENGNGKTTLLRLLYGELRPDNGSISYHISGLPDTASFYDTKTRLGFIPQRPNNWYGSLMANLQFTATHYGYKGRDNFLWTELVCARMGLRAFRTFNWNRISSGYKMRFELAKAIIKKPQVLLLDEPLANLDVLAQQVILEDLRFLAESEKMPIGIILSSQQLYEVEKVSQQVIFLKNGSPKYQQTRMPAGSGSPAAAGYGPSATTGFGPAGTGSAFHATPDSGTATIPGSGLHATPDSGTATIPGSGPAGTSASDQASAPEPAVFELETTATREQLQQAFTTAGLQSISFNGGVYLLYFDHTVTPSVFITLLGQSGLPVRYFRDISTSSRRFFNA